jgi:hypothetical protein
VRIIGKGKARRREMGNRDTKRKELYIADSYEPLNIVALSQDDRNVILSAHDFEKLLVCRDMVLYAFHSKEDLPYSLIEKVLSNL